MTTHNAENERIKRRYFAYLKEARRYSEASVDAAAKALNRFECFTRFRSFKSFHIEQAVAFKRALAEQVSRRTGDRLSKATLYSTLKALHSFFSWLAGQPGFRSRLSYSDAEYFNLSKKDVRVATAHRETAFPSLEQIQRTLAAMPVGTDIEQRNRAVVAFTILTGARDSATASFKLRHIDVENERLIQDARHVRTKFSKTFTTWFFPVGEDARRIVLEWIDYLTNILLFGPDDPLFPATRVGLDSEQRFAAIGLSRNRWSTATPIRDVFRAAFASAGLPYFNPHSFRHTLAKFGEQVCRTPEEFKAWSQNLGHEDVLTTFSSYGSVASTRQAEIMQALRKHDSEGHASDLPALLEAALAAARRDSTAGK